MDDALPANPPSATSPTPPAPPAAPSSAPSSARRRPAPAKPQGNVKETVEQILVAFILAFVFRCFVVEAFVIPTGSMAPTLLGAHVDFRCVDCGWHWSVNYSGESDGDDVNVPARSAEVLPARCPNCGYKVPRVIPTEPDNGAATPPVRFGDRILVQKYVYLLNPPRRWDVVVFKTPDSGRGVEPFTQNYIKRLVGRPGETIMILDGDVYVAPSEKPLDTLTPDDFVVQAKPRDVQEALWRIVYDADHRPRGQSRTYVNRTQRSDPSAPNGVRVIDEVELAEDDWRDPWLPRNGNNGNGWRIEGRDYRLEERAGTATLRFDAGVAPERHPLTDWLAYNVTHAVSRGTDAFRQPGYDAGGRRNDPINNVGDVKLSATYQRTAGEGAIRFNLTKQDYRFTAELTPTRVRLLMKRDDQAVPVEVGTAPWSPGTKLHRIELTNVDYRVTLRIDDRDVLSTTPEQYKPDVAGLLADFEARRRPPATGVWIEAEDQSCTLRHLALWRDVYYLNRSWGNSRYRWAMPDNFPIGRLPEDGLPGAGLIQLGEDEYFTLGDNSMMSADARVWLSPVQLPQERLDVREGRVPGRFLLGRAFFVYWPAGYAPFGSLPAFVPNFGEMRLIH